jgi:hypothetical protein
LTLGPSESTTYVREVSNSGYFNIRWLLRAIARRAAKAPSLVFSFAALYAAISLLAAMGHSSVAPRTATLSRAG